MTILCISACYYRYKYNIIGILLYVEMQHFYYLLNNTHDCHEFSTSLRSDYIRHRPNTDEKVRKNKSININIKFNINVVPAVTPNITYLYIIMYIII